MPAYRSRTTTSGRRMAAARGLWRATGMTDADFGKPIVAIANSFSQFVPGHVHLRDVAAIAADAVRAAGGVPREFNTIAIDDGIAMGHGGMLYSLPSRELIADAVEYVVQAHCADALLCIGNCDKISPGMLMAIMRLNIPAVFVSGGPMEAGRSGDGGAADLIDIVQAGADPARSDADVAALERDGCPTCGSCSGMFTANSMNCLAEALGLALPGNGSLLATHARRRDLFAQAGRTIVALARRWYEQEDEAALPRGIAGLEAFENAMRLDLAMGGSTNTVLHLLAIAEEGEVPFRMADIDRLSRTTPHLCKVAPSVANVHMEDVHRAGGIVAILGELARGGLLHLHVPTIHSASLADWIARWDIRRSDAPEVHDFFRAAPGGVRTVQPFSQARQYRALDLDRRGGVLRDLDHAFRADGGLAVLTGNLAPDGCVVKSAGVPENMLRFEGPARVFESQEAAGEAILARAIAPGSVIVLRFEGPKGGPGMQEMLYPTTWLRSMGLHESCALVTDGRFSGGSSGLSIGHVSPEAAEGGAIGLVRDGDPVGIDIPARRIELLLEPAELDLRRRAAGPAPWSARDRARPVSRALRLYARSVSSASRGAVRVLDPV